MTDIVSLRRWRPLPSNDPNEGVPLRRLNNEGEHSKRRRGLTLTTAPLTLSPLLLVLLVLFVPSPSLSSSHSSSSSSSSRRLKRTCGQIISSSSGGGNDGGGGVDIVRRSDVVQLLSAAIGATADAGSGEEILPSVLESLRRYEEVVNESEDEQQGEEGEEKEEMDHDFDDVGAELNPAASLLMRRLLKGLKYDVQARKICSSCREHSYYDFFPSSSSSSADDNGGDGKGNDPLTSSSLPDDETKERVKEVYESFCGDPDAYGHEVPFSGLLLLPVVPPAADDGEKEEGDAIRLPPGQLQGAIWHRPTKDDTYSVPSEQYHPGSKATLAQYDFFGALWSASKGYVTLLPDGFGYGESGGHVNKSYLVRASYLTSTVPLYLEAMDVVRDIAASSSEVSSNEGGSNPDAANDESNNDATSTLEGGSVLVAGYSEGGYAAVTTAVALHDLGLRVEAAAPGDGPYGLSTALVVKTFEHVQKGTYPDRLRFALALLAASYSSTNPSLVNSNRDGQNMLGDDYMPPALASNGTYNVIEWVEGDAGMDRINELLGNLGPTPTDIFNPKFVDMVTAAITNGSSDPCAGTGSAEMTQLCLALQANDLTGAILNEMDFPTQFCHSVDDQVSDIANLPDDVTSNPHTQVHEVTGTHKQAAMKCLLSALHFFSEQSALPDTVPPLRTSEQIDSSQDSAVPVNVDDGAGSNLDFVLFAGVAMVAGMTALSVRYRRRSQYLQICSL